MRHRTCFTIVGYDMKMHAYAKHYAQKCQTYIGQYMRCIGLKTTPPTSFERSLQKMDTQSKFEFQLNVKEEQQSLHFFQTIAFSFSKSLVMCSPYKGAIRTTDISIEHVVVLQRFIGK